MVKKITTGLILTAILCSVTYAQDETTTSPFTLGADVVSSYVWRGTNFGGPAIQPGIAYNQGGLTLGAWGSWGFDNSVREADLYVSYEFGFGLTLGLTDYHYQGGANWLRFGSDSAAHAYELNAGYQLGSLSLSANYILNQSDGGDGSGALSMGGDTYFELSYAFKSFDVFIGAGNGWHTTIDQDNGDDAFGVCRVGIGTSKEVKITENYSLPLFGSVEVNPNGEEFNIVVGVSF
jgi:hypothetical protein